MNYVTTNIRLPEDTYLQLKHEAAKQRKTLSAIIRERLGLQKETVSKETVASIMQEINASGAKLGKKLHGIDSVQIFREMRYKSRW